MSKEGVLYIVATPIGNLDDISVRALQSLKHATIIAAEDTRHSQKLLHHFGIGGKLVAYHDHSSEHKSAQLISQLQDGEQIALISDAGTPLISDPGYRIVSLARAAGIKVVPIPGASAPITALSACGLPTDKFTFQGFLPAKSSARRQFFESIEKLTETQVCFESPHRIVACIDDAVAVLGGARQAVLARELTKTFETFLGASLADIQQALAEDSNQRRGEMVLMLAPAPAQERSAELTLEHEHVLVTLCQELPTKQASTLASKITGVNKKVLYQRALELKA